MKKKILTVLFVTTIFLSTLAPVCFAKGEEKDYSHLRGTSINVYNWGEYISDLPRSLDSLGPGEAQQGGLQWQRNQRSY